MPTFRAPRGTRVLPADERIVFDRLRGEAQRTGQRYGPRTPEWPLMWIRL